MKNKWEVPTIETLDLMDTAYSNLTGVIPDGMKEDCNYLYVPES